MNIKQAAEQSGVSARNIRYYEQAGLLTPARNPENEYRIYSQADVRALKLIRMLRTLDMPVEEIGTVLNGTLPLAEAAERQRQRLEAEQQKLAAAAAFCTELAAGDRTAAELDVDSCLERMDSPAPAGGWFTGWVQDYRKMAAASISGSLPLRRTPPLQLRRSLPPSCWPGLRAAARRSSSPTRAWRRGLCWTASSTGPCGIRVMCAISRSCGCGARCAIHRRWRGGRPEAAAGAEISALRPAGACMPCTGGGLGLHPEYAALARQGGYAAGAGRSRHRVRLPRVVSLLQRPGPIKNGRQRGLSPV